MTSTPSHRRSAGPLVRLAGPALALAASCFGTVARVNAQDLGALESSPSASEEEGGVPDYVQVAVSTDKPAYHAGETATVTVEMRIDPRVHINAHVPTADFQYPTDLKWAAGTTLHPSEITWPKATQKAFEFTEGAKIAVLEGRQRATFTVAVPAGTLPGTLKLEGKLKAQGCTHSTCYAPQTDDVLVALTVVAGAATAPAATSPASASPAAGAGASAKEAPPEPVATPAPAAALEAAAETVAPVAEPAIPGEPLVNPPIVGAVPAPALVARLDAEKERAFDCPIQKKTPKDKPLLWVFLASYVGGLFLTFTPCVLPLVPITIGYFSRQQQSGARPVVPALLYVLGLALVYGALGAFAALTGRLFGSLLQSPVVLIGIAALLLALSLSMFGLWEMNLPAFVSNRIGGGKSGPAGAMMMGGAMGLVAAPCVGPFVVSLLTYVAELGSHMPGIQAAALGGALFFVLALGLGTPFFLVALGTGSIRPGEWMVSVKKVFGFVILGVVLWFLRPLVGPAVFQWGVIAVVAVAGVFFLRTARGSSHGPKLQAALTGLGAAALVGAIALSLLAWRSGSARESVADDGFTTYSEAAIGRDGKPVVIDFTAEWCIACQELKHQTFVHPMVTEAFKDFQLVKADMTNGDDAQVQELTRKYAIRGLPTIVFLDPHGQEIKDLRLTGFEKPDAFVLRLKCASSYDMVQGL